jgi:uncharacterized delta-60 repeat protein
LEPLESRLLLSGVTGDAASFETLSNGMPILHSRSAAAGAIFLDYDGDATSATTAYDADGDPTTFNAAEQAVIVECWRQTAVFYAMFDLDVTTIQPDVTTVATAWAAVGNNVHGAYSGVDVYPNTRPRSFVSSAVGADGSPATHEIGHNLGNGHQSVYDEFGTKIREYAAAEDTDLLHGPLMGNGGGVVEKWSVGHPSSSASSLQDDMAVIAATIRAYAPAGYTGDGYAADDYAGTQAEATPLVQIGTEQSATGVIERLTDVDTFSFPSDGGRYAILASRDWPSGVDLKLSVYDASGNLVARADGDPDAEPRTLVNDQSITLDLPAGTYYLRLESHGDYADQGQYLVRVNPLPTGWSVQDVGLVGVPGCTQFDFSTDAFTVAGSGTSIGGAADGFQFAYQTLQGDGTIVARVANLGSTTAAASAGVMIRESLNADARQASVLLTCANGVRWSYRESTGGSTSASSLGSGTSTATWVKLVRAGDLFRAYASSDGVTWTSIGSSQTIAMNQTVYVGLATTAAGNTALNAATLDYVTLTGVVNPQPTLNSLAAPAGLTVSAPSASSLSLQWNTVPGATGYVVERSADGGAFVTLGSAAGTAYVSTGLSPDHRYFYRVRAQDASGVSPASNVASGETRAGAASGLSAVLRDVGAVILDWEDTSGESGYRVEYSTDGQQWTTLATVGENIPSVNATGLSGGTEYWFRVVTLDAGGDAAISASCVAATRWGGQVTDLRFTSVAATGLTFAWTDIYGETGYLIERGTTSNAFTTLATLAAGSTSYTDTGLLPLAEYYYRVTPLKQLATRTSYGVRSAGFFTATQAADPLPAPWRSQDVGTVVGPGAAAGDDGSFTVIGGGTNISGTADNFQFLYQVLGGNCSIVARVASQEGGSSMSSIAGVMIRASLVKNAPYVAALDVWNNGLSAGVPRSQSRTASGGTTSTTALAVPGDWLRVARNGNTFTVESSSDGAAWTTIRTVTVAMGADVYVGLVVSAGTSSQMSTCTFDHVALAGDNHAPVLDSSGGLRLDAVSTANRYGEGTPITDVLASGGGAPITDADYGALQGIAVTAADDSHGTWQFSTNGGNAWTGLGPVSTTNARLLAADASTRLRFIPDVGYTGTVDPALTFHAWDRTSGTAGAMADASLTGGTSAFSAATETASVTVVARPSGALLTPAAGTTVYANLGHVDVAWIDGTGSGLNEGTIDVGDITVSGVAVTSVTSLGDGVWRYAYRGQWPAGTVTVTFAAGAVQANDGSANLAAAATFNYDPPPTVSAGVGTLAAGSDNFSLTFSEPVNGADQIANYALQNIGADGLLGTSDDVAVPFAVAYAEATARFSVAGLAAGVYRLTVRDALTDSGGRRFDGDGDGIAGGVWTGDFVVLDSGGLYTTTDLGLGTGEGRAVAVQADGKILVVGEIYSGTNLDFGLVRYNADGSLDTAFGESGVVLTAIGTGSDYACAVTVQPDGKILVAGYAAFSNFDFAVARYNADGSLDTTFGDGGIVSTAIGGGNEYIYGLAVQEDGGIVAAGCAYLDNTWDIAVARYLADGSLDPAFGDSGIVTTSLGASNDYAYAVTLQSDGKIVVVGASSDGTQHDMAAARYNVDGSLDADFGVGGWVTTPVGSGNDYAYGVALQPDGRIVAAGYATTSNADFAAVRYNTDGSLDSSFNGSGKVTTAVGSSGDYGRGVVVQPDGTILVAGYASVSGRNVFAAVRYTETGTLDRDFGGDGKLVTAVGSGNAYGRGVVRQPSGAIVVAGSAAAGSRNELAITCYDAGGELLTGFDGDGMATLALGARYDEARAVARQSDGRIIIAGSTDIGSGRDFAVARYTPDGTLDTAFGTGGMVVTGIGSAADYARAVAITADGKIVVAGHASNGNNLDFAVVRYTAAGVLDTTFGASGKATAAIGSNDDHVYGMALQADGKIVLVGDSNSGGQYDLALARFTADGALDPSFGSTGKVTTALGPSSDYAYAVAIQSDGKIVVAGYASNGSNFDLAVVRYRADGSLDPAFGTGGHVTTSIGSGSDCALSLALQADGKIVIAGYAWNGSNVDFVLARYNSDGSLDTTFNNGGTVLTAVGTGNDYAYGVTVQADGKIVAVGCSANGDVDELVIVRYTADGSLDTTFDNDGQLRVSVGTSHDRAYAVTLGADGQMILAGQSYDHANANFLLATVQFISPAVSLLSAHGVPFDVDTAQWGAGQLMAAAGTLDGLGRLSINGVDYTPIAEYTPDDSGQTIVTGTSRIQGLSVHREVTVPEGGNVDFARTLDVFENTSTAPITLTVRQVGNLGFDGATTVFATSDGDTLVEPTDLWIGIDNGTGTSALILYLQGFHGLQPDRIEQSGDNVAWTYTLTVPAGATRRLAYLALVADTRDAALAAAGGLVALDGLVGQAAGFLTAEELGSVANFAANSAPAIAALAASPAWVFRGDPLTLTAVGVTDTDPRGTVVRVDFYRESNGTAGLQRGTGGDTLVDIDTDVNDGWSVRVATSALEPGPYTYYAVATDNEGAFSADGPQAVATTSTLHSYSLDVDGNGTADALTDGILILRYLFAPNGAWNYGDAVGTGAARATRDAIRAFLNGASATLDVDGNGTADALTDGILILRYLFAPAGAWNFSDAIGPDATRTTRPALKAHLDRFNPSIAPTASLLATDALACRLGETPDAGAAAALTASGETGFSDNTSPNVAADSCQPATAIVGPGAAAACVRIHFSPHLMTFDTDEALEAVSALVTRRTRAAPAARHPSHHAALVDALLTAAALQPEASPHDEPPARSSPPLQLAGIGWARCPRSCSPAAEQDLFGTDRSDWLDLLERDSAARHVHSPRIRPAAPGSSFPRPGRPTGR